MEKSVIMDRLSKLRRVMAEKRIDYYMIPTADYHGSEYVHDYFQTREYFSGFTGSAGTLVVWAEGAALWTDGRYFIQAAMELEGTGITLMKMREQGVPTISEFLMDKMQQGMTLGFDGRVIPARQGQELEEKLSRKMASIAFGEDLAESVWRDRPSLPAGSLRIIGEELSGENTTSKIERVREKCREQGADSLFLTKLDDIMWLLNIRGCDVECNPVAISYLYLTMEETILFLQKKILTKETESYFATRNIVVREYGEAMQFLAELEERHILMDQRYCSYAMYRMAGAHNEVVAGKNPTELMKAIKNPVELANMEKVYHMDNVAVTKFIYWLKTNIGKLEITEITAADYLEKERRKIPEFIDLSFPTIAGYGTNGAIVHYEATPESNGVLAPKSFLLVDSGGQYLGGTTDITRTISLGALTREERYHYTLVAAGMIQMTNAKFLHGCTGRNLDILARGPLWEKGLDYKHGTGHGVGYILNVHEGPQSLRWQYLPGAEEYAMEEGMDVTNEPGIYEEGKHGIRIENVMVVKKSLQNEYGQFMEFDTLTWVPLDREALDVQYLSDTQLAQINAYQKKVYEKLSPYLTGEEREWLFRETRELTR